LAKLPDHGLLHFAHDCFVGDNCITSNNTQVAGHVTIGDWAIIGGMCAVHQFVKIGAHSFISGGSLVGKDVPPYIKAGRTPLSYAGVNSIGSETPGVQCRTDQSYPRYLPRII
jgi:UDP-N-acetylglucosamine acyltransferase